MACRCVRFSAPWWTRGEGGQLLLPPGWDTFPTLTAWRPTPPSLEPSSSRRTWRRRSWPVWWSRSALWPCQVAVEGGSMAGQPVPILSLKIAVHASPGYSRLGWILTTRRNCAAYWGLKQYILIMFRKALWIKGISTLYTKVEIP